ncbi:hypothetical protein [Paraburkholderia caffeinilytica]
MSFLLRYFSHCGNRTTIRFNEKDAIARHNGAATAANGLYEIGM